MDEVLLIQECLKGKRKAQGELYRRYAAKMMGVCMRYSRNRDMAHDLLQEGFIKVFTNLNEYSGNGSFEGWMRKIFINCALEKIRRSKVFPLTFPTEETEQETSFPNALEEISAQEMLDLIHRLPPGYKRFSTCLRSKDSHTRKSELCSESQKVLPDHNMPGHVILYNK